MDEEQPREIVKETHTFIKSIRRLYLMHLNMSLGLFVFGFNQGIFNVLKLTLLQLHGFSGAIQLALYRGVMTASNPIGGLIGNLFSHYFLKKVGKIRHVAIITDAVSTAMVFLECGSNNLWVIIVGRLFLGICGGINTAICPIYTREFSPIEMVSRTGFIGQLLQRMGLLLAFLIGYALPDQRTFALLKEQGNPYNNQMTWRIVLGVPVLASSLIRMLFLIFVFRTDTPMEVLKEHQEEQLKIFANNIQRDKTKYQILDQQQPELQKNINEAKKIYDQTIKQQQEDNQLEKNPNGVQIINEMPQQQSSNNQVTAPEIIILKPNLTSLTKYINKEDENIIRQTRKQRYALGICISLAVGFSSIDVLFFYSNYIFESLQIGINENTCTVLIGVFNLFFSQIASEFINTAGRRTVLLAGSFIITCALVASVVAAALKSQTGLLISFAFILLGYCTAVNPVRWACFVQILDPPGVRLTARLIFTIGSIVAFVFPLMAEGIQLDGAFAIFLAISALCLIYLYINMREIRGKSYIEVCRTFLTPHKQEKCPYEESALVNEFIANGYMHLWSKQQKNM